MDLIVLFLTLRGNWEGLLSKWVKECATCAITIKNFHFENCSLISLSFSSTIAACHTALSSENLLQKYMYSSKNK